MFSFKLFSIRLCKAQSTWKESGSNIVRYWLMMNDAALRVKTLTIVNVIQKGKNHSEPRKKPEMAIPWFEIFAFKSIIKITYPYIMPLQHWTSGCWAYDFRQVDREKNHSKPLSLSESQKSCMIIRRVIYPSEWTHWPGKMNTILVT